MMKLYDISNNRIDIVVSEGFPRYEAIKITNKLLNGRLMTQTIGTAAKYIDIKCAVREAGKNIIDSCYTMDDPLTLHRDGRYYTGLILKEPSYTVLLYRECNRMYMASFTLAVNEEGDIE